MEHTTALSMQGAAPANPGAGRDPVGQLVVDDYVGALAADATQALRRAGLRPGLERCHGYEAAQVGYVVAQQPPAGSRVARNSVITLHVAAPAANTGVQEPAQSSSTAEREQLPSATDTARGTATFSTAIGDFHARTPWPSEPTPHTGGPPGVAGKDRAALAPATTTAPAHAEPLSGEYMRGGGSPSAGCKPEHGVPDEHPAEELPERRLLELADKLFAAHRKRAGRWGTGQAHLGRPREDQRVRRARDWLRARSRMTKILLVLLAIWAFTWTARALSTDPSDRGSLKLEQTPAAPIHIDTTKARTAQPTPAGRPATSTRRGRPHPRRGTSTPDPSSAIATSSTVSQPPPAPAQAPPPVQASSPPSAPAPVSQPSKPPPEQTQGGPFSP